MKFDIVKIHLVFLVKLQGNEEKEWDFKKFLMKNQVNFKDYIKEEK